VSETVAAGYFFSINPAMLVSESGQKAKKQIPADGLLTETDGPFTKVAWRTAKTQDTSCVYGKLWTSLLQMSSRQVNPLISANFAMLIAMKERIRQ
jgi:TatD DNase family protein